MGVKAPRDIEWAEKLNVSRTPMFVLTLPMWLDAGGVYALPNLSGGAVSELPNLDSGLCDAPAHVRFGSNADMCGANSDVC